MPITPTEKIWMDGELVDWDDATVHVLTHTLHYGSGVFEGIRAYPTSRGVAVFRLSDHIRRLFASAKVFMIDVPYTVEELMEATRHVVRVNGLHDGCYLRPLVYLGYGEMGLNPLPCPVNVAIAAWPWGTYLGDEGVANGVRCKVSSWQRHDPNAVPTAAKGTGMYVNSSLAKVEALKAGYDEAILLAPDGRVSECTGENIFIVRDGVLITPPTSDAGALEGITQDSVETIARDLGIEVRHEHIIRTDLYIADEAFLTGTAAEVVPIRAVDDRRSARAAPAASPRRSSRPTSPPCGARWTGTRTGSTMSTDGGVRHAHANAHGHSEHAHDFSVPELPEAVDIFDTTLRDGSQQEGLSLTVDDKLRVAEQLDHLGVTYIEGGWPGANPKDDEFFARAPTELTLGTATLVAFGSTRRAGVRPEDDAVLANLIDAGAPVVCIVAKSWDRHVTEALRTTLDEAVAMVADSVRYLREHDLRVFLDAEHFFDGYKGNPSSRWRSSPPPRRPAPRRSCCATPTAARCPTTSAGPWPTCGPAPAPSSASTATTTPAARWPTPWWPCRRARPRCRGASTATASGPATRTCRPPSPTWRSS